MFQSQQISPLKTKRGYIVNQGVDWSVPNNAAGVAVFDWNNQGASKLMDDVAGAWIDNSKNANTLTVTCTWSQQVFVVYGNEVVTVPLFSNSYPKITVTNANDVAPGVGVTQIIFADFDLGFNISQSGSGAAVAVNDAALNTLLGSTYNYTSGLQKGIVTAPLAATGAWVTNQITFANTNAVLVITSSAVRKFWYVQNVGADAVYVAGVAAPTATSGAYKLSAGQSVSGAQLADGFTLASAIYVAPTAAGDVINVGFG